MTIYTLTLQTEIVTIRRKWRWGDTFIVIIKWCLFDNLQCNRWQIPSNPGITAQPAFPACPSVGRQNNVMTQRWRPRQPQQTTSTVYWCIASKLKAPRNFYWMSNMFLWVEIFIFFVCYHVVPKRHSQLDYELNGLWNKIKLKTTRWRWCFFKIFTMTMSLESFDQLV